jgi:hypothetical protein
MKEVRSNSGEKILLDAGAFTAPAKCGIINDLLTNCRFRCTGFRDFLYFHCGDRP